MVDGWVSWDELVRGVTDYPQKQPWVSFFTVVIALFSVLCVLYSSHFPDARFQYTFHVLVGL